MHSHVGKQVPAKHALEEQVLGPHNAVDWFVGRVADRAHGVALGRGLRLALKALRRVHHLVLLVFVLLDAR